MSDEKDLKRYERNSVIQAKRQNALRTVLVTTILTAFSLGLCLLRFKIPYMSNMFAVDFSVFFELVAALAYGPIAGIIATLIKFLFYVIIEPTSFVSSVANFIIESIFISITGIYYLKSITPNKNAKNNEMDLKTRRQKLFAGSVIGIIPALIAQFYLTNYFVFPTLVKNYRGVGYTFDFIFENYYSTIEAIRTRLPEAIGSLIPEIGELWQGTLLINLPITLLKLLLISLVAVWLYPPASPYLHFEKRK